MPNTATLPEVEIFSAGRHPALDGTVVDISAEQVAEIAAIYDPAVGEAPHVIGHPTLNAPAYGWVKKLVARDGVLFAAAHDQVEPQFLELVKSGRIKKRSSSFFLPDSPGNPKPGSMYLRHVGWLGAAAPAVTGLRDVQFAGDAKGVIEFASDRRWGFRDVASVLRRLRDWVVERDGAEKADLVIPTWQVDAINEASQPDAAIDSVTGPAFAAPTSEEPTVSQSQTADFAARESALNTRQQDVEQREKALRDREAKARRDGVVEFASALVKEGRLLPRHQAPIVELLVALESGDQPATLNFAAADGGQHAVQAGAALRGFLSELPPQIDYREKSAGTNQTTPASFAAPPGAAVDATLLELHGRATAYQRQHPNTSWLDAVAAVGG